MRKVVLLATLLLWAAACSSPTPEQLALLAAKGYYQHLVAGQYADFLSGKYGADTLTEDYRAQLQTAYRQFMSSQLREHRGILEVRPVRAVRSDNETYAFLVLCYSDSTSEEIVVPMVETNGQWRMK